MNQTSMTFKLFQSSALALALAGATAAMANSPVGQWHTIDDKTGEP
jgi:hypothetical protein